MAEARLRRGGKAKSRMDFDGVKEEALRQACRQQVKEELPGAGWLKEEAVTAVTGGRV